MKYPMWRPIVSALPEDFREAIELDLSGEELLGPVPRRDVPLAIMLMLGSEPWQRIDGMGLARKALDAPFTGDPRRDLNDYERGMLAAARARCLVLHCDFMLGNSREDPIVVNEASRYAEFAIGLAPDDAEVAITLALVRLRQKRAEEASELICRVLRDLSADPNAENDGRIQGAALLSILILAISKVHMGDCPTARALIEIVSSAQAPIEIDDVGCASLIGELSGLLASAAPGVPGAKAMEPTEAWHLLRTSTP